MAKPKILLVQLNSNGDCLYATVIAKQIKEADFPGCHLTWAVNRHCRQSVHLNPHVDSIWEVGTERLLTTDKEWEEFVQVCEQRKLAGDFDIIFYTQVIGKNTINFDGGIRSSMYNNYPYPITVSCQPVIRLDDTEVQNVVRFSEVNRLADFNHIILLECGPDSFRSSLNMQSALAFAKKITASYKDVAFILSSNKKLPEVHDRIFDASTLTFRENAELTRHCTLFIGCSSGISWLTTTDWAKPLQKIIITNKSKNFTFSMVYDHEYARLPTEHIIEFAEGVDAVMNLEHCLRTFLNDSFENAKRLYHKPNKIARHKYIYHLSRLSFKRGNYTDPISALKKDFKKNGFDVKAALYLLKAYVKLPNYLMRNIISRKP